MNQLHLFELHNPPATPRPQLDVRLVKISDVKVYLLVVRLTDCIDTD